MSVIIFGTELSEEEADKIPGVWFDQIFKPDADGIHIGEFTVISKEN